eukprot:TRINITY_DN11921_c0_g1_i1.p1 TRINITY_DN11921_c0_g1~~TRINITY_DN11921_c0_g1_i1.p1  ORF type:complete len:217 (-),score=66.08 TRINITY_DN11921_c0_g1_i1:29-679(-)
MILDHFFFFFFKQKTAYEMLRSLVGSEMCIRDRVLLVDELVTDVVDLVGEATEGLIVHHDDLLEDELVDDVLVEGLVLGQGSNPHQNAELLLNLGPDGNEVGLLLSSGLLTVSDVGLEAGDHLVDGLGAEDVGHGLSLIVGGVDLKVLLSDGVVGVSHCIVSAIKYRDPVLCVDTCLLYTSDAADEEDSVDLGGRRIIKKKKKKNNIGDGEDKVTQ